MRKQWLAAALGLLVWTDPVPAQDRGEVFGGYSYVRTEGDANLHGWIGEVAFRLSPKLDFVADFSGHYTSVDVPGIGGADADLHNFLFGIRYGGSREGGVRPFVHGLLGFSRTSGSTNVFGFSVSASDTGLGLALGGGFEVPMGELLSIRAVQADYLLLRSEGDSASNARLSAGVVARF